MDLAKLVKEQRHLTNLLKFAESKSIGPPGGPIIGMNVKDHSELNLKLKNVEIKIDAFLGFKDLKDDNISELRRRKLTRLKIIRAMGIKV